MRRTLVAGVIAAVLLCVVACQSEIGDANGSIAAYRDRMLVEYQDERAGTPGASPEQIERRTTPTDRPVVEPSDRMAGLEPRESLLTDPASQTQPPADMLLAEIPDPTEIEAVFQQRLKMLADVTDESRVLASYEQVVERALRNLELIKRPTQVRLSLAECIQRALSHNYSIRIKSYDPAIATADLVEAEAVFDAEFFLDTSYAQNDAAALVPTGTEMTDGRSIQGGIRQLLPTGMSASVGLSTARSYINSPDLPKKTNPSYSSSFVAELRQPLMRGFGLEYNRASINIARASRDISYWQFVQEVRDQLLAVEQAYWNLVQARRTTAILAESVAQNYVTYLDMWERRFHDATPVEIANSKANYQIRWVEYLERVKDLKEAEDALKLLLNDPELKLSTDIEIITTDAPLAAPLALDHFAEVRAALENRSEIRQARLAIDSLRIATAAAKNQTLPQLDLTFQYEVAGAGLSADDAFDEVTTNNYISYAVGVSFSYPIGNRSRRAQLRSQQLQESQAVVQLEQVLDGIVREVNTSIRSIGVRYTQLPEQYEAVQASARNLRSLQARAPEINPSFLETELSAVQQLASSRTTLLGVLVQYNYTISELERNKGTLLEYNNVTLTDEPPTR
ncbi:MAG: TolC family protein [Phycisphaerae bacterium]|nr:TolC family protein [Phycisphaerae bacterium]